MNEYMTLAETSEYIGKSKETLRRWDKEGKLLAVREPMSNYRVYRKSDIDTLFSEFLDQNDKIEISNFKKLRTYQLNFNKLKKKAQTFFFTTCLFYFCTYI